MRNGRRKYTPEEKVAILRRHLAEKESVSSLCEEYQIHPTVFYRWRKVFFENGATASRAGPMPPRSGSRSGSPP